MRSSVLHLALVAFAMFTVGAFAAESPMLREEHQPIGGQYLQTVADLSRGEATDAAQGAGLRPLRITKQGVLAEGGTIDDTTTTVLRASVHSPADATTVAATTSSTTYRLEVKGRATLYVSGHFTVASESCVVQIIYAFLSDDAPSTIRYEKGPVVTLTAGSSWPDAGGLYMSSYTPIDGAGAKYAYPVISTMPATGNVSLTLSGP